MIGILLFFWFGLSYPFKKQSENATLHLIIVCLATYFNYFVVPGILSFAYVSTTILLIKAMGYLLDKEADKYYGAASLFTSLPISLFAWVEALMCDSFLVHVGGHLWYDLTIPISMVCYLFYIKNQEYSSKKVKAD